MMKRKTISLVCAVSFIAVLLCGCSRQADSGRAEAKLAQKAEQAAPRQNSIGTDEAFSIALQNAGVSRDEAYHVNVKPEQDKGLYDVEFNTAQGDYDFKIAMAGGEVVSADYEAAEEWLRRQSGDPVDLEGARAVVLEKVPGAPAGDIRIWEDSEHGLRKYEGRLFYGSVDYEFEIDAATGIIAEWKAETRR